MRRIYVCSPLRGNVEVNIEKAKKYCRAVALKEKALPIAPHIYFTQFLNDDNDFERVLGLDWGLDLLEDCDELWVFGKKITGGMKREIEFWENTGRTWRHIKDTKDYEQY